MSGAIVYDARIDGKKRVTLRGATFDFYHVEEYPDGRILLEPRELVVPYELSKRTLETLDRSMVNFKKRKASKPVDLTEFKDR